MDALLFPATSLLWGCGAFASTMQAGITPAAWSVSLRMSLAGIVLLACGRVRGARLGLKPTDLLFVGTQGILFFAVAFIAFYEATRRMPSGLAALVLATSSFFAALLGRAVLGEPLSRAFAMGMVFGLSGVAVIVLPGFGRVHQESLSGGAAWALVAAVATAAGTVTGSRNQKAGLNSFAALGWAAVIGGAASAIWAIFSSQSFVFDSSTRYVMSLAYLTLGASCAAFLLYFELVSRQGAGRAAYVFTTIPVIALVLSSLFEGLRVDVRLTAGALAIIFGKILVLNSSSSSTDEP